MNAHAYVSCQNIPIAKVESASSLGFHGMNKGGATGAMILNKSGQIYLIPLLLK